MGATRYVPIVFTADGAAAQKVVEGLTNAFDDMDEAAEGASNGGLRSVFIQADLAARAISYVTREIVENVQEYFRFSSALSNLNTLLDDSTSITGFRDGLLELHPALGRTSELARGTYQAISSGIDASEALDAVAASAKAAKAGLTDTYTAVDAGTTVMASFGKQGRDLTEIYDKMFETVKRGKVEFSQLAQSIGLVSNIAATAGLTLDEMFAGVATSSRTMRPTQAIEGMRSAISNIIKPSQEATKLAGELGIQFDAQALKAKGLSGFLNDVAAATGNDASKMNVLFGDIQALAFVMSVSGNQAKTFASDLKGIAAASGTVEEAFQKQRQNIGAQIEEMKVTLERGFIKTLLLVEPLVTGVFGAVNKYPAVFVAASTVVLGLAAAHAVYNTQLGFSAAASIPNFIKGIQSTVFWMVHLRTALTDTQTAITALTGWVGLAVAAIGLIVYAISQYETATERANNITAEQIDAQARARAQNSGFADELRGVSAAQSLSADQHERLNAILGTLDPTTQAYINSLKDETEQVRALAGVIKDDLRTNQIELEATLRTTGKAIIEQGDGVARYNAAIAESEGIIQRANHALAQGKAAFELEAGVTADASAMIERHSERILSLTGKKKELNEQLVANIEKNLLATQALGYNRQGLVDVYSATLAAAEQHRLFGLTIDNGTKLAQSNTNATQQQTGAINEQAAAVKNLKDELDKLNSVVTQRRSRIDLAVAQIASEAKSVKEAKELLRQRREQNQDFRKDLEDQKRYDEIKRGLEQEINPTRNSGGSRRTPRVVDDAEKFSLSEFKNVNALFKQITGRNLPVSAYGQTPYHNKLGLDHSRAVDVAIHPNSADGRILRSILEQMGVPFRGLTEADKARGVKMSAPHFHVGSPSHAFGKNTQSMKLARDMADDLVPFKNPDGSLSFIPKWRLENLRSRLTEIQQSTPVTSAGQVRGVEGLLKTDRTLTPAQKARIPIDDQLTEQRRALITRGENFGKELGDVWSEAAIERGHRRMDLLKETEQVEAKLFNLRDENSNTELVALRRCNTLLSERLRLEEEASSVEDALAVLREQNGDAEFVRLRRNNMAAGERLDLERAISAEQDRAANAGANAALRYQLAHIRATNEVAEADIEANESIIRSRVRLADQTVYHEAQANARILEFLAEQKSMTEIVADAKIGLFQKTFDGIDKFLDRAIPKLFGFGEILKQVIGDLLKLAASRELAKLLGLDTGNNNPEGGRGGDGILSTIRNLFGGGGSDSGPGGTPPFNPSSGGGIVNAFRQNGVVGGIKSLLGLGPTAAAATATSAASSAGSIGLMSTAGGIPIITGLGAGGAGAGAGAAGGGAAAGGGLSLSSLAAFATNPITLAVAGAAVAGFMLWRHFRNGTEKALKKEIAREYALKVEDMATLKEIKALGEQTFGKGNVKKHLLETIRLDPVKELLAGYAERTGQTSSKLVTDAQLKDPTNAANQFVRRIAGGRIPGETRGFDHVPVLGDGGEYVIRSAAVEREGLGAFDALNTGRASIVPVELLQRLSRSKFSPLRSAAQKLLAQQEGEASAPVQIARPAGRGRSNGGGVPPAMAAAQMAAITQLADAVGRLERKITSMRPTDVVGIAKEEDPETFAEGAAEGFARSGSARSKAQDTLGMRT